jgi:hypothetical protein
MTGLARKIFRVQNLVEKEQSALHDLKGTIREALE